ncbi:MAG: GtrA family protein [Clostridia bacterium]|nr:GtrA family protein [Clostridia bacterium]
MKEFFKKFFDIKFWKFILVGIANTLFGSAIMFLFYNAFHFSYWVSSAANYVFGSILSYFLNKHFTFRKKGDTLKSVLRFTVNILLCYLLAYGIAKPLIARLLSTSTISIQENVAMLAGMVLFVAFNYIGQRFFVFRDKEETPVPETEERKDDQGI